MTVTVRTGDFTRDILEFDYLLYEAGTGRPPLLSLLPACYIPGQFDLFGESSRARSLQAGTGLLRRSDAGILVVQLDVVHKEPWNTADLCVLRPAAKSGRRSVQCPSSLTQPGAKATR